MEGEIIETLRNGMFRITLDNGHRDDRVHRREDEALPDPDGPLATA